MHDGQNRNEFRLENEKYQIWEPINFCKPNGRYIDRKRLWALGDIIKSLIYLLAKTIGELSRNRFIVIDCVGQVFGDERFKD